MIDPQLVEIKIHEVGREGQGVGFDDANNIYFVRGAIPGDRVRVLPEATSKRYKNATLVEVMVPSEERVTPECPHFLSCGGCDWLQWDYPSQCAAKERSISHILTRSELSPLQMLPIRPSPHPTHYRNRVQLRRKGKQLGFFRRDSHDIVDIETCALASAPVNEEIAKLRLERAQNPMGEKIELAVNSRGEVRRVFDSDHGAEGFRQINEEQNEFLRSTVRTLINTTFPSKKILELFCGDGNLTFAYATKEQEIVAIDSHAGAIARAEENLTDEGLQVRFESFWIGKDLLHQVGAKFIETYDTLVLDPPRSGIGARVLQKMLGPRVKKIIYISCSALTFSQDVKELSNAGFLFRSLQPIDMFPQTHHVELVGYFVRPQSS